MEDKIERIMNAIKDPKYDIQTTSDDAVNLGVSVSVYESDRLHIDGYNWRRRSTIWGNVRMAKFILENWDKLEDENGR